MKKEFAKNFQEIMNQYNIKKQEWIARFGNDKDFDKWFTGQIMK